MDIAAGIDIGGTKCAVSFAEYRTPGLTSGRAPSQASADPPHIPELCILDKSGFPNPHTPPEEILQKFITLIREKLEEHREWTLRSIGISCGGPLNAQQGLILGPPNLPEWRRVDCVSPLRQAFRAPVALQNDADACALAEWKWGAGQGYNNLIFLTFGTGMGAGLILNGQLYRGAGNLAGEVGHIRLAEDGPWGYGKYGSFEGFCSGGGIAHLGRMEAERALQNGKPPLFCKTRDELPGISAKSIAQAMNRGDALAAGIYRRVGEYLGRGLALLIDIFNPEAIILGSIYVRQQKALEKPMREQISREALSPSASTCCILPAGLGEGVGDFASISVGIDAAERENR